MSTAFAYWEHKVKLADQLAEPSAKQSTLCVLVTSKDTAIEWHVVKRTVQELSEYLDKVGWTAEAIASGRHYKRPGFWCSWCDFLSVCLGNKGKVKVTMVQRE